MMLMDEQQRACQCPLRLRSISFVRPVTIRKQCEVHPPVEELSVSLLDPVESMLWWPSMARIAVTRVALSSHTIAPLLERHH